MVLGWKVIPLTAWHQRCLLSVFIGDSHGPMERQVSDRPENLVGPPALGYLVSWRKERWGPRCQESTPNEDQLSSPQLRQLWKSIIFYGKFHYKWPFSIAMLVCQRGSMFDIGSILDLYLLAAIECDMLILRNHPIMEHISAGPTGMCNDVHPYVWFTTCL